MRPSAVPHTMVDYRELTTQPQNTVHKIYDAIQMPLTDTSYEYLQSQEERGQSHKTDFRYSMDEYSFH